MKQWGSVAVVLVLVAGCTRQFAPPASGPDPFKAQASPAFVSPRGLSELAVSGGTPPYSVDLRPEDDHSGGDARLDTTPKHAPDGGQVTFTYRAGSIGGQTDRISVADAARHLLTVDISVGAALELSPSQLTLAPRQHWAFTVSGGAPPYRFQVSSPVDWPDGGGGVQTSALTGLDGGRVCVLDDGGSSSCIDAAGRYDVRANGSGADTVSVVDSAGIQRTAVVTVSNQLELLPTHARSQPGASQTFVAIGGVPPYRYAFDPRGDRSQGQVGSDGIYQAGPNANVDDVVQVTDAVGAVTQSEVQVGSPAIVVGAPDLVARLYEGVFTGSETKSIVAVSLDSENGSPVARMTVVTVGARGFESRRDFSLQDGVHLPDQVLVGDLDGDGTDDLVLAYSGGFVQTFTFLQLVAGRRDGSFDFGPFQRFSPSDLPLPVALLDVGYQTSLAPLVVVVGGSRDGGPAVLNAFGATGRLSDGLVPAGTFGLPFNSAFSNIQVFSPRRTSTANDPPLYVAHGSVDPNTPLTCSGGQPGLVAWRLAFTVGVDGGLARDAYVDGGSSSDTGPFCVASPQPATDQLAAVNADGLLEADLAADDGVTFDLSVYEGSTYRLLPPVLQPGQEYGQIPPFIPLHLGQTLAGALNLEPASWEVLLPGVDAGVRLVVPRDGGSLLVRDDVLEGGLRDALDDDFNGDGRRDLVTISQTGELTFRRGYLGGRLALGHDRILEDQSITIPHRSLLMAAADVDGDGTDDLLILDGAMRLFWGDRRGVAAAGPRLAPGFQFLALERAFPGAWALAGAEDGGVQVMRLFVAPDGGFGFDFAPGPSSPSALAGLHLGTIAGVGDGLQGVLLQVLGQAATDGGLTPFGGGAGLQLYGATDGGLFPLTDPLLATSLSAGAPVEVSGLQRSDLVIGARAVDGGAVLALFAATAGGPTLWEGAPRVVVGVGPGSPTAIFSYPSRAGGPRDRLLVALGGDPGPTGQLNGVCPASDPASGMLTFSVTSSSLLPTGRSNPDAESYVQDFCTAVATWSVHGFALPGGEQVPLLDDRQNLDGIDALFYQPVALVSASNVVAAVPLGLSDAIQGLAVGDFDGDGRQDLVHVPAGRAELQFTFSHPDGGFY
jgi:hypothetical protein